MAKYTDEQIKKARAHFKYGIDCDIFSEPVLTYAKIALDALDLINRQEAEIERLQKENAVLTEDNYILATEYAEKCTAKAKSEAIKEFAETYKNQVKNYTGMFTDDGFYVSLSAILDAVDFVCEKKIEELVGESK